MFKKISLILCALGLCSAAVVNLPQQPIAGPNRADLTQDLETAESAQFGFGGGVPNGYQAYGGGGYGGYGGGLGGGYGGYGGYGGSGLGGSGFGGSGLGGYGGYGGYGNGGLGGGLFGRR